MLNRFGYGLQKSRKGCNRQRKAAEENKSAWELMETNFLAFLSHASKFFKGMEALPLLEMSSLLLIVEYCQWANIGFGSCKI